ncbi:hypothetical protein SD71_05140 [Cohnella kolymensis]|uniref:ABC transmembrane type-1 domain-containing protein n=1 Tax=Cohnella kolymensis TaxID=1590652 RepID=A0ABR5A7S9_9BACL|nr:ABC transporter permease subunit [Cohnella kolymensis]KIL37041.1 hypothetical protein SD71_05140 [Cohnella kolymensis]
MKTFIKWGLLVLFTLAGIFLLGNLNKAFINQAPDLLQVGTGEEPTLEYVSSLLPGSAVQSEEDKILRVPYAQVDEYAAKAKRISGVWYARSVPLEKPVISFKSYWYSVTDQVKGYFEGDFGSIRGPTGTWEIPIGDAVKDMFGRSFSYLIPGLLLAVCSALLLSLLASLSRQAGRFMDGIHTMLLGLPDFVLVTGLTITAIFTYKSIGVRLFNVAAFGDTVPFYLPLFTISLIPGVLIYGTLRLAIQRELEQDYVVTAKAKGLSGREVLLNHVLRNITDDLLTIMPKATNLALGSMVVAEAFCDILGLGGIIVSPKLFGVSAMPVSCLVLAVISILFHTVYVLLRKRFVVRIREVA